MKSGLLVITALFLIAFSAMGFADTAGSINDASDGLLSFFERLPGYIVAATTLVTAATAITMVTPSKTDDAVVNAILRLLNILAGNIGANRNKDS